MSQSNPKNSLVDSPTPSTSSGSSNGNGGRLQQVLNFIGHGRGGGKKRSYEESESDHCTSTSSCEEEVMDVGGTSGDDDMDDTDTVQSGIGLSGWGLRQMLSNLGSRFRQSIRAKKQKLDEDFKDVKVGIETAMETHQKNRQERDHEMGELYRESGSISDRLTHVGLAQKMHDHKELKMLGSVAKSTGQVKNAMEECIKTQSGIFQKFVSDLTDLEEKYGGSAGDLIHQCKCKAYDTKSKTSEPQPSTSKSVAGTSQNQSL